MGSDRTLERLSSAVEAATDGIAITDHDGVMVFANTAVARIYGFGAPSDLVGRRWTELFDLDRASDVATALHDLAHVGRWQGKVVRTRLDGTQFRAFVSATSTPTGDSVALIRDLTEEERLQHDVEQREERYRLAARAAGDVIIDIDLVADRAHLSGAIGDMLGLAGDTAVHDRDWWHDHIHPEDRPGVSAQLSDLVDGGEDVAQLEYRVRRTDGAYVSVLDRVFLVRAASGTPVRIVGSLVDMTERHRHDEELETARTAALAATEAKSAFLASMSHEIRTPMHGIIGMLQVLLGTDLTPAQRYRAEEVCASGEHLMHILDEVLDLSKVEAGAMTLETARTSLPEVVAAALSFSRPTATRKDVALRSVIDPALVQDVVGDRTRLTQVLGNLVGNAVKFTDEGEVVVTAEVRDPGDTDLDGQAGRLLVRFTVRDTGPGLSPEEVRRLFEAFTQADRTITPRYGGTGLGLALCAQLTELMGGRIWCDSTLGEGSAFHVEVPLQPAEPTSGARGPAPVARPDDDTRPAPPVAAGVLLVEDDELSREVTALMLERLGHSVELAEHGQAALDALEHGAFDLVLMDVQMPVLDGMTATRRLRTRESATGARRTPVVALSASAMGHDRDEARAAGMDDYVSKPFGLDQLAAVVSRWGATDGRPAAPESPPGDLDETTLTELRSLGEAVPDGFLDRMVTTFHDDSADRLGRLCDAIATRDVLEAVQLAHYLRGSCANVGARALARSLEHVEQLVREADLDAAAVVAAPLRQHLEVATAALRSELGTS